MRDTYHFEEPGENVTEGQMVQTPSGMRHSIRPRRVVIEQAQKRALTQAFETTPHKQLAQDAGIDGWDALEIEEPGARRALTRTQPGWPMPAASGSELARHAHASIAAPARVARIERYCAGVQPK